MDPFHRNIFDNNLHLNESVFICLFISNPPDDDLSISKHATL
jgi:hypothetical protein